jgi:nucleotide-binding universal stress UspA family protein
MSVNRVVVGVDGSPNSKAAVAQASHFASSRGMRLQVLHAFAPDLPMLGFGALSDRAVVTEHGQQLLDNAVARAHSMHPDLEVTQALQDGYASEALVAASRTAALVVVGATGHGILSQASVGPTAMQVVTHARCPVLVVGHETSGEPRQGGRVIAGVDGSDASMHAVQVAHREAAVLGGPLLVVHAWQARSAGDPTLTHASSWDDYAARLEESVEAALADERRAHPDVKVEYEVVSEEPAKALADRTEDACMLVVGSRGSGGFPGLHVGSVALQLMGRSRCPVLLTR